MEAVVTMRLKNKFRPNLSEAGGRNRLRRLSGGDSAAQGSPAAAKRVRSESGCKEAASEASPAASPVAALPQSPPGPSLMSPPPIKRVVDLSPCSPLALHPPASPVKRASLSGEPPSPASIRSRHLSTASVTSDFGFGGRHRRPTESSRAGEGSGNALPASVFNKRKADHKKKFNNGIPERSKMTVFDLIYYNPSDGSRMSNSSSRR